MLSIINRGKLLSHSFYDKDGLYWNITAVTDSGKEYVITLKSNNGLTELFVLKRENLYELGYELGLLADNYNMHIYIMKTYLPIESIKDKGLLLKRMKQMIDETT